MARGVTLVLRSCPVAPNPQPLLQTLTGPVPRPPLPQTLTRSPLMPMSPLNPGKPSSPWTRGEREGLSLDGRPIPRGLPTPHAARAQHRAPGRGPPLGRREGGSGRPALCLGSVSSQHSAFRHVVLRPWPLGSPPAGSAPLGHEQPGARPRARIPRRLRPACCRPLTGVDSCGGSLRRETGTSWGGGQECAGPACRLGRHGGGPSHLSQQPCTLRGAAHVLRCANVSGRLSMQVPAWAFPAAGPPRPDCDARSGAVAEAAATPTLRARCSAAHPPPPPPGCFLGPRGQSSNSWPRGVPEQLRQHARKQPFAG